ncbi:hypothetical protein OESDEN_02228 [Oesophagostomum dentatum]|uniref:Derlin n=1 Tax=Oesophagostomum dentatum TaxID=61180 RepID=A0A0B1TJQ7_OESDE|nr:hypothetical protein OESDEN_02228 [Oesophagostomum dentatum]
MRTLTRSGSLLTLTRCCQSAVLLLCKCRKQVLSAFLILLFSACVEVFDSELGAAQRSDYSIMYKMPSDLGTWFRTVPIVTRYWFALSVIIPLLGRFGLINPLWMYLDWDLFVYRFHVSILLLYVCCILDLTCKSCCVKLLSYKQGILEHYCSVIC